MRNTLLALALATGSLTAVGAAAQQTDPSMPPPPSRAPMRGGGMGPMGGGMGGLMQADTNHDGVVTREEAVAAADVRFDRLDTNRDGVVSADEMSATMPPMAQNGQGNGQGSGGNAPAMPAMTRQQFHDRALRQFDRFDLNHDGKVDASEMASYRDMMRERRQERNGGGTPPPPPPAGQQ